MTLKTLKENVLKMIEEISQTPNVYTDDPDINEKLNTVINQVMFELARMKKIPAQTTKTITSSDNYFANLKTISNMYQIDHVRCVNANNEEVEFELFGYGLQTKEACTAYIYYYEYPTRITSNTVDATYTFTLDDDVMEILPYGVAADLLKSDVSANYGNVYAQRYETMLQRLDYRYNQPMIYIETEV